MPLLQKPDAQSPFTMHGLPLVGFGPRGVHVPPPAAFDAQVPPQQSLSTAQEALSATQWTVEQIPFVHEPVQQSTPVAHVAPGGAQVVEDPPHFPVATSQLAEQHSVPVVQALPLAVHDPEPELPPPPSSSPPDGLLPLLPLLLGLPLPGLPSPPSALAGVRSALSLPHPVDAFMTAAADTRAASRGQRSLVMSSTLPLAVRRRELKHSCHARSGRSGRSTSSPAIPGPAN
jgi:hypothetical protein